ncbi:hypothetical protein KBP30_39810 [Streptomyces sp. Go40/10]|uniref:hypothetical protein n=1 Tax=Streptomyces sp. Go40/10 TaxID=2825844 RepID=UPI001E307F56|nr:hypothetical protein [Streptomyces sp. Go40/10]UFR06938.1 hypothetical protein KBP30_39810 [Streptomyces sp. Go40/10]
MADVRCRPRSRRSGVEQNPHELEIAADGLLFYLHFASLPGLGNNPRLLALSRDASSYWDIAKASREPKPSQAGITEFLKGGRLPQLKALMEFVRVVSAEPHAVTGEAASRDAAREEWCSRWTRVRGLQRQAWVLLSVRLWWHPYWETVPSVPAARFELRHLARAHGAARAA